MNSNKNTIEIGLMEIFIGQMLHVLDRFFFLIASEIRGLLICSNTVKHPNK